MYKIWFIGDKNVKKGTCQETSIFIQSFQLKHCLYSRLTIRKGATMLFIMPFLNFRQGSEKSSGVFSMVKLIRRCGEWPRKVQ